MNYSRTYNRLIETRRVLCRIKSDDGLLELHHIIPRSLGGDNKKEKVFLLTPREHYLAHWLLYKIHKGQDKARMAYAFFMMSRNNPNQKRDITSRMYERAKDAMRSIRGEAHPMYGKKIWSDEQKAEISKRQLGKNNSMYGKVPWNKGKKLPPLSPERIQALADFNRGRPRPANVRKKISEAHKGKKLSDATKQKLSVINKGKKIPRDVVEKIAAQLRGRTHPTTTCPHCHTTGGYSAMQRWHFDRCRELI